MERENLYVYTELPTADVSYVGYLTLNREVDGTVTLTVRSSGDMHTGTSGTITLPPDVMAAFAAALSK
jgi:hypothetical protein